jgi:hypothetical protein
MIFQMGRFVDLFGRQVIVNAKHQKKSCMWNGYVPFNSRRLTEQVHVRIASSSFSLISSDLWRKWSFSRLPGMLCLLELLERR